MTSGVKYAKQVTFGTDLIRYATDPRWYHTAVSQLDLLLIDHAHCEKKAASFAMGMIYRYVDRADLLALLSPLVREEMLHFEQVMGLLKARHITYRSLPAARYTRLLLGQVCQTEPNKLLDTLLIAALIEARSCERFLGLSRILPVPEVAKFYRRLYTAEKRHAYAYLDYAAHYAQDLGLAWEARLSELVDFEGHILSQDESCFRFHSGIPLISESD